MEKTLVVKFYCHLRFYTQERCNARKSVEDFLFRNRAALELLAARFYFFCPFETQIRPQPGDLKVQFPDGNSATLPFFFYYKHLEEVDLTLDILKAFFRRACYQQATDCYFEYYLEEE